MGFVEAILRNPNEYRCFQCNARDGSDLATPNLVPAGVRARLRPFADFASAMALDMALDATDFPGVLSDPLRSPFLRRPSSQR